MQWLNERQTIQWPNERQTIQWLTERRTNINLQNTTKKTKHRSRRTPLKTGENSGTPEG